MGAARRGGIARLGSLALLAVAVASHAGAQVSVQAAERLGEELTPIGAERAGNADGTIPAWTGGIQSPPPGYAPGDWHADPFPEDRVLFEITAANPDDHAGPPPQHPGTGDHHDAGTR